tara:strand:- start:63 stop:878 length:816 start_codon:yes stop_codon:yes gene_type:complete
MAETLTYDPGTEDVTNTENLSESEQQALQKGEELQAEQEQLLAGKYKDAEELEKAYMELSKKLGEKSEADTESEETDTDETEEETETEEEEEEYTEAQELILESSKEFEEAGALTPETIEKFSAMSSKDLVEAYMKVQAQLPQTTTDSNDIPESAVNQIKNFAGGEQNYANMVQWAGENLDSSSIEAFDSIVNSGSVEAIKLAVSGLKGQYEAANGYEGTMYTGKAPTSSKDIYRSQAELVRAMNDPRYDNDPAYRQDVIDKLDRSDQLQF